MNTLPWADQLLNLDEDAATNAWSQFSLNEQAVLEFLCGTPPERVWNVLESGLQWNGKGWGTTRCALAIRQLTGFSLVQSTVEEYMKAFLYSVALAAGVDVPRVDLSPAAAEAAFKMHNGGHKDSEKTR